MERTDAVPYIADAAGHNSHLFCRLRLEYAVITLVPEVILEVSFLLNWSCPD